MLFRQIVHDDMGCASYFIADGGSAVVVDPRYDIAAYCELAEVAGVAVAHVVDTHDHADHVSGRGRLARLTGAAAHRPARACETREGDLRRGDELWIGSVVLRVLPVPGHRPESIALALIDSSRSLEPWAVLTGDSLLVGDVARPDLAGEAARAAALLHESLASLAGLGDHVEVWPGHVGGSLCGGAGLSLKTSSTIGFERRANQALHLDRQAFVAHTIGSLPPRPPLVGWIAARNGGELGEDPPPAEQLSVDALTGPATILDMRDPADFDAGHLAGSINLPAHRAVGTRAGWIVGADTAVVVVAGDDRSAQRGVGLLHAAGIWNVRAAGACDLATWTTAGLDVRTTQALDAGRLAALLDSGHAVLVDVRDEPEWEAANVRGSIHLPLHELGDGRDARVPKGRTLAVACARGPRAALAASLLRRGRKSQVLRLAGGIAELPQFGTGRKEAT